MHTLTDPEIERIFTEPMPVSEQAMTRMQTRFSRNSTTGNKTTEKLLSHRAQTMPVATEEPAYTLRTLPKSRKSSMAYSPKLTEHVVLEERSATISSSS